MKINFLPNRSETRFGYLSNMSIKYCTKFENNPELINEKTNEILHKETGKWLYLD